MTDEEKIVEILNEACQRTANEIVKTNNKSNLKYQPATVVSYDDSTYIATVYFGNNQNDLYTFYNKSGCKLYEGDNVKIQYTSNPAKGDLVVRSGRTDPIATGNGKGKAPIVNVVVNSNFDFTLSTNDGTERYVAVTEE